MNHFMLRIRHGLFAAGTVLTFVVLANRAMSVPESPSIPASAWPMFHGNERHTGVASGQGNISKTRGPVPRWKFRVFDQPASGDLASYRWTSSFPLGDLDGDGVLDIVVTTPDTNAITPTLGGQPAPHRVIALKDAPGQTPPYRVMWIYTSTLPAGGPGLDTYSPALADADGDGKLDVIFTGRDGFVRALKGTTGQVLWEFNTNRLMEAGPIVADLDGNGTLEAIVVTDCRTGVVCPNPNDQAYLFVLPVTGTGTLTAPLWSLVYPFKLDSAVPAVADLDPGDGQNRKAIIMGTWGGELLVAWRNAGGLVVTNSLRLRELDHSIPTLDAPPVIRSSPLVWNWGEGETIVFGWLPSDLNASDARVSAVGATADMAAGTVSFTSRWITKTYDVWKSSPALIPRTGLSSLAVMGYGLGVQQPDQSGPVGRCDPQYVTGGVVAFTQNGFVEWGHNFGNIEGNIRASAASADLDGDGRTEVILPTGCYGKLHAYDGLTGAEEWTVQLGPLTQGSPSVGDIVGNGKLEIVVGSYDGNVWVLGSGSQVYLPAVQR